MAQTTDLLAEAQTLAKTNPKKAEATYKQILGTFFQRDIPAQ